MQYTTFYNSPLGEIMITADEIGLTELFFCNTKNKQIAICSDNAILKQTTKWLDEYFNGNIPSFSPPLHATGTDFQMRVWKILSQIPYGKTISYSDIAKIISKEKNIKKMSAQAVGHAVSKNKIAIILPCHRVIGKYGNLTGYAAGIDKKIKLLQLEGANLH